MKIENPLLRLPEVMDSTSYSKSKIYRVMKEGTFPKNINLGSNSVRWITFEVETHIENKIEAERGSTGTYS